MFCFSWVLLTLLQEKNDETNHKCAICTTLPLSTTSLPFNKHAYCTHKNTSNRGNLTDVWTDSKLVGWTFCGHLQSVINKEGKLHSVVTYTSENPNKLCIFYVMTQNKVHLKHIFMCICYLGIKIALKCNILPIFVFSKQNTRPSECRFFFPAFNTKMVQVDTFLSLIAAG